MVNVRNVHCCWVFIGKENIEKTLALEKPKKVEWKTSGINHRLFACGFLDMSSRVFSLLTYIVYCCDNIVVVKKIENREWWALLEFCLCGVRYSKNHDIHWIPKKRCVHLLIYSRYSAGFTNTALDSYMQILKYK